MKHQLPEPTLEPEDGWNEFKVTANASHFPSFVSGEPDGDRLRVRYFVRERDGAFVGKAWFGPGTEGPPGHAHGGSVAALLDEAMGLGAWAAGHSVLAVRVTIQFRAMLPLGTEAMLQSWVDAVDGRKVTTRGRLSGPDDIEYAVSDGLFLILDADKFGEMASAAK